MRSARVARGCAARLAPGVQLQARPRCLSSAAAAAAAKPARLSLAGILPPICTPFEAAVRDGQRERALDLAALRANVRIWSQQPLRGLVVLGSNGEAVHLTTDERVQLVATVSDELRKVGQYGTAADRKIVVAGAGCDTTAETIHMTQLVAQAGAHAVLVMAPHFFKSDMHSATFITHFTKVADASPVPVILYDVPKFTGVEIGMDVCARMAAHPNVIGIKDSGGNITRIAKIVGDNAQSGFQVLAGSAGFLLPTLVAGGVGAICALAGIAAKECNQIVHFYDQNQIGNARAMQYRLIDPNTAVTTTYSVAGLKAAMDMVGLHGGFCREPLQPLSDLQKKHLRGVLEKAYLLPK